ncbi:hypothetical protein ETD86_37170, partial [Nonomuraea turkmeniaca]
MCSTDDDSIPVGDSVGSGVGVGSSLGGSDARGSRPSQDSEQVPVPPFEVNETRPVPASFGSITVTQIFVDPPVLIDPLAGKTSKPCAAVATQDTEALRALSPILAAPSISRGQETPSRAPAGAGLRRVAVGTAAGLVLGREAAGCPLGVGLADGSALRVGVGEGVRSSCSGTASGVGLSSAGRVG